MQADINPSLQVRKHPRSMWNKGIVLQYFLVLDAFDARLGHIDLELIVSHGIVVEHTDRLIGISLRGHGYKGKAFRRAGALFGGDVHRGDCSGLRE